MSNTWKNLLIASQTRHLNHASYNSSYSSPVVIL